LNNIVTLKSGLEVTEIGATRKPGWFPICLSYL